ncbi:MAG: nuclear transport factor 2 family protein [Novosphingobium sp.]
MTNPDSAIGRAVDENLARDLLSAFSAMANSPSEENLARLATFYAPDLRFEDPGQIFERWEAYANAFMHFRSAAKVGLNLQEWALGDNSLFLRWGFFMHSGDAFEGDPDYNSGDAAIEFDGFTFFRFNADGKVQFQQEGWAEVPSAYRQHLR